MWLCIFVFLRENKMSKARQKILKLTKQETKTYSTCLGQCTTCLLDGACELQDKIKGVQIGNFRGNNGCKDKQEQK